MQSKGFIGTPRDERVVSPDKISFLSLFKDRRSDIVVYRGAIFNQKGYLMLY